MASAGFLRGKATHLRGPVPFLEALSRSKRHSSVKASSSARSTAMQLCVQEVARAHPPLLPRSGHAAATLPDWHSHDVIVLGGYTEKTDSGQMQRQECMEGWVFSSQKEGAWQPLDFAQGPIPAPRLVSQAVVVDDNLYLVGGWNPGGSAPFLNDIWRLDLKTNRWTELHPEGEPLPAISRHQAVAVGKSIYIIHHRSTQDISVLDVSDPTHPRLSKVPVKGDVPSSRGLHSLTAVAPHPSALPTKLFLFGGAPQRGPMMSDLYALDLLTNEWTKLSPSGAQPHARCAHGAAAAPLGRHLLVFGGAFYKDQVAGGGGLQVLDDTICYDTVDNKWVPVAQGSGPPLPARNAHTLVPIAKHENKWLLHGGWVPFVSTFNDTYVVELKV
mmetsp:Transcript_14114/g.38160  ORF Transcript_14114/g.38160 Transcript_14114/m.38160 type:complete len:386 (+) Transcript_14114:86-1243(+)|eukprot:CAMPEP_0202399684 /NCGR_PEP_ID=MMETSP1128-20130828/2183_1 /ASSEMBLY_ACC=CAM_ASM_000463 /TAXON_ID=3047 /ORGANISM="Dunaliella tertiolecta, Strain CCMP1320" /LENGTH=385 /DNA_ID=CAMNT_0049003065 /DNA_START=31 /DNA_END=1188 /DNA_ORIENTATION=+